VKNKKNTCILHTRGVLTKENRIGIAKIMETRNKIYKMKHAA
jgi:hypothetical protein